jgi:hypothetical protein
VLIPIVLCFPSTRPELTVTDINLIEIHKLTGGCPKLVVQRAMGSEFVEKIFRTGNRYGQFLKAGETMRSRHLDKISPIPISLPSFFTQGHTVSLSLVGLKNLNKAFFCFRSALCCLQEGKLQATRDSIIKQVVSSNLISWLFFPAF